MRVTLKRSRVILAAALLVAAATGTTAGTLRAQGGTTGTKASAPTRLAYKAARMLDPVSGTTLQNVVILVDHDTIVRVGSALAIPVDVQRTIDLGNLTVLPGLIDVHSHLTSSRSSYYDGIFRRTVLDNALRAPDNARRTLEAGFTTVRDVGAPEYLDVALRNAINRGELVGPRMHVATMGLSSTGGHGDLNGFSPYLRFDRMGGPVDGIDAIRKRIRDRWWKDLG